MRITYKDKPTDPFHPIMHGTSPMAKEFNKRQKKLLKEGKLDQVNFEQVSTILLEILVDDYNEQHKTKKK